MSFLVLNINGSPASPVELNDLGITVPVGLYDFRSLQPNDVSDSAVVGGDLYTAIDTDKLIVIDPIDGVTPLSKSDSIELSQVHNDPHFRIRGGTLNQLDDVTIPGSPELTNEVLQWNGLGSFIPITPEDLVGDGEFAITDLFIDGINTTVVRVGSPKDLLSIQIDAELGLNDISDVNLTGSPLPAAGDVLIFAGSPAEWQHTPTSTFDQNLWATISSDSGNTTANIPTDILTIAGGTGISTSVIGDTLTIDVNFSNINLEDINDVVYGSPRPAAGDILSFSGSPAVWTNIQLLLTDMAGVQARRSTTFSLPTSYGTITFNNTDVETDDTVVSHNPVTNSSRITISETGLYLVGYSITGIDYSATNQSTEATTRARVIKNGVAAALNGSYAFDGNYYSFSLGDAEHSHLNNDFLVELTAGDYIEVQAQSNFQRAGTTGFTAVAEVCYFYAIRQKGAKGDQGPAGSGSNITIKDEGINVANTPHSALNFTGSGVTVTDGGSGVANVAITGTVVQIVHKNMSSVISTSTTILDSATPTSTSGVAFDSLAITMTGANTVRIQAIIHGSNDNDAGVNVAVISRSTTVVGMGVGYGRKDTGSHTIVIDLYDTPGAGTHTYNVRVGVTTNTGYFNQHKDDATPWGGTAYTKSSNITLTEIL